MSHRRVLQIAAIYNLVFGVMTLLFPVATLTWAGMEAPRYPQIWQCLGMVIGVYGVGYWIASWDPIRHWPIVFVGLLGKVLGPIGFVWNAAQDLMPWSLGWMIITNDLIWWIPFSQILWQAWGESQKTRTAARWPDAMTALANTACASGERPLDLSQEKPVLLVFLRHLGCTFCMETLHDLGKLPDSDRSKVHLVLVSMGPEEQLNELLVKYGVKDADYVIDPDQQLYRAFSLPRGSFTQLFGWRSFAGGLKAFFGKGVRVGKLAGDGFQMPGGFVLHKAKLSEVHRAAYAADVPNYVELIRGMDSSSSEA